MKLSIRSTVLIMFTALVLTGGVLTITLNYFVIKNLLKNTAELFLSYRAQNAATELSHYLSPFNNSAAINTQLIQNNTIIPDDSVPFRQFLTSVLVSHPVFDSVFWSAPNGNFYLVEREIDLTFGSQVIRHDLAVPAVFETKIDSSGSVIAPIEKGTASYNPRSKSWYIKSITAKKPTWTLYAAQRLHEESQTLGLNSTWPVYTSSGQLKGMLGVRISCEAISHYLSQLKVTENAVVFICNNKRQLMAANQSRDIIASAGKVLKVDQLNIPWATSSFDSFMQKDQNHPVLFSYQYKKRPYLAAYFSIPNLSGEKWYIAFVAPEGDFTQELKKQIFLMVLLTLSVFVEGAIIVWIMAGQLAKPIVRLTNVSNKIQAFDLDDSPAEASMISEIDTMQKSFHAVKVSLKSFQKYLPYTLVKELVASGELAKVGGEERLLTFFFMDIAGFSTLSEFMKPSDVMLFLSEFLDAMMKVISARKGTIDKWIGDCVMAFWGAPLQNNNQAIDACFCALDCLTALAELNKRWEAIQKPTISVRVGINTGPAIVGSMGGEDRLSYTALGDAVNLASRLQSIGKLYHTCCIISEFTYQQVKNYFVCRLLDRVMVRGKKRDVYVYELIRKRTGEDTEAEKEYHERFMAAFELYQLGHWDKAITLFQAMQSSCPNDYLLEVYLQRCTHFQANPPDQWNGVWVIQ